MLLSWQGFFGQGSKVVCCFSFPMLWICPSNLKKKDILLSILSIFVVCCPGKEGKKPPEYPEKKRQFTLLVLMKPLVIKVLSKASCLSLWRKINQSKEEAFVQNAGLEECCQKNILIWGKRVVVLYGGVGRGWGSHLQCLLLGLIGQEWILEDGGIVLRN